MPYDMTSRLWPVADEAYFRDRRLDARKQAGPSCVHTALAIVSGALPDTFRETVNTQDPVSWSEALRPYGMKLAYCPVDVRRLLYYLPELVELDDLFLLGYYTTREPADILGEPDERGWLTGSHLVVLHRDKVLNPSTGKATDALRHRCRAKHTKRIFRVVPLDHTRGL